MAKGKTKQVAVVGGGLIGSAVAFELSQAGAEVVVLDAGHAGAAWRAGAGMLTLAGERLAGTGLEPLARESLSLWPDFARRLEVSSGRPVYFRAGVELADYGPHSFHQPSTIDHHHEATTHPPSVVAAALHGLDVRRAEVLELEKVLAGVRLRTSAGTLDAARVVLAAGAWSGRFGLPVSPVRGQAALFHAGAALPARYTAKARGFRLYGLPRPDGHYVGATVRVGSWHTQPLQGDSRWLCRAAPRVWPEAAGQLRPAQMLVGLRPCTADGVPIMAPLAGWGGRVWAAAGHGRHGALLAPATAQHITKELL